MTRPVRRRFEGHIAGLGTAEGTRVVLGMWQRSPFGAFADAMVERADGHRVLIAPTTEVASYVAGTYMFDEVVVQPTRVSQTSEEWTFESQALRVLVVPGRRTAVGVLLRCVPAPLARARWWAAFIDPFARRLRQGVRTVGTTGGERREWYGARDEHVLHASRVHLFDADLGALRDVTPPVRFGFGSTPRRPSLVQVVTTVAENIPKGMETGR